VLVEQGARTVGRGHLSAGEERSADAARRLERGPLVEVASRPGIGLEPVLEQQAEVVALIEDLAPDVGIERAQPADLAVLLRDQLLVEGRDLDVEVELGEVEVRREALSGLAPLVPRDVEGRRFVAPLDRVEVQEPSELALAVVSEVGALVRQRSAGPVPAGAPGGDL
jgi:hypothetical protein